MKLAFADAAEAELERLGDRIAEQNPPRAVSFIREIRESCDAIALMPKAFGHVRGLEEYGIRRMSHGDYVILYFIGKEATNMLEDCVTVLHVVHGAQDYAALLSLELAALA